MTREQKLYRVTHWIAVFLVAAVFFSGYKKVLYPADFAATVYQFKLLPEGLINAFALYLPCLELVCALSLLIPRYRWAALWVVLGLLLMFTGAIGISLWRGASFGCGCFGRGMADDPLSWIHLLRNLGLITLVFLAMVAQKKSRQEAGDADG